MADDLAEQAASLGMISDTPRYFLEAVMREHRELTELAVQVSKLDGRSTEFAELEAERQRKIVAWNMLRREFLGAG
jgi:hypothetical protein